MKVVKILAIVFTLTVSIIGISQNIRKLCQSMEVVKGGRKTFKNKSDTANTISDDIFKKSLKPC